MIWLVILLGLVAVEVEARNDQHGESKKDKVRDAFVLAIAASCLCLLLYWLGNVHPLKTIALLLGVRVLVFDYRATYLLIKNKVIVGNWWSYTGKTARWDKLISRIPPWLRLLARVILFAASLIWFLASPN